jgi:hypothetical protein
MDRTKFDKVVVFLVLNNIHSESLETCAVVFDLQGNLPSLHSLLSTEVRILLTWLVRGRCHLNGHLVKMGVRESRVLYMQKGN